MFGEIEGSPEGDEWNEVKTESRNAGGSMGSGIHNSFKKRRNNIMYQDKLLDQIKTQEQGSRNEPAGFRPNPGMGGLSPSKESGISRPDMLADDE